jgi:deoxyribonucleoside regulator
VPEREGATELETLEEVARYAARLLNAYYDSNMVMGVAWGTTVAAVSRHLVPKPTRNCRVVQLNGAGNLYSSGVEYASEILRRFGVAYRALVDQFPVPTFFDHEATKTALWRESSVRRIVELQNRADVVLFGIGTPNSQIPGQVYRGGYLTHDDLERLRTQDVVGDVATVFLRRDGSWHDIALNARSSGPNLERLRKVDERLCVVAEVQRVPALRAAIAAGLVSQLIIDERAAVALLDDNDTEILALP